MVTELLRNVRSEGMFGWDSVSLYVFWSGVNLEIEEFI